MPILAAGRQRWHRLTGAAVLAALAATWLAACRDEAPEPDPRGDLRIAVGKPETLLPTDAADPGAAQVLAALFAPLTRVDPQGRWYPVAAATLEPSQDGRVWTIGLREGFTFHDGEPVTADRYLAAWNFGAYRRNQQRNQHLFARIEGYAEVNPPAGRKPTARTLSGLDKVDDHTFTVRLSEPFGQFPALVSAPAFAPLPSAAFTGKGTVREEFARAPVGNGPYRLAGGEPSGERLAVERHPAYPGEAAPLPGVEFRLYPDPAAAYPDLLAGEVDLVTRIPPDRLATAESDLDGRVLHQPAPEFQYLAVPAHLEQLSDPRVRRAISMAIDRDGLAGRVSAGAQAPARAFVAPVAPGARVDTCGDACRLDPAAARTLYAEAGGPDRLTITYNADGDHRGWVEETCRQLRENLGVACRAAAEPTLTDVLRRVDAGDPAVGLPRLGWGMDYPSMESYLGPVYSTTGSANFSGYRNPEFDRLLAAAAAAGSAEAAVAAYQRAEAVLARDLPVIPLRFGQHTIGYSTRVGEVHLTPLGQVDLTRLVGLS